MNIKICKNLERAVAQKLSGLILDDSFITNNNKKIHKIMCLF